jgi:arylsulfatase A-like enzyme
MASAIRGRVLRLALLFSGVFAFSVPAFSASTPKPNIILITLEGTRADRVGFLGSNNPTPALDALAKQSIIFERAYAQAPLTIVSHATILSGTYPQIHHASELGASLAPSLPYLPDLLHSRGYRTAAFVGSTELDPRNGLASGFDRGFDMYDASSRQAQGGKAGTTWSGSSPAQVIARAAVWLKARPQAFFLWINLNSPQVSTAASYDRGVNANDTALSGLVSALRAQKLLDDSIVVVTADHGEGLGTHGEDSHGIFIYEETTHVPLLVKLPENQLARKRVKGLARLVDVAPTVLEIAGIPVPSQMQGQSLLRIAKASGDAGQPVYARTDFPHEAFGWSSLESWRTGKYLYIRAPKPELYDLSSDPNGTHNLAQSSKATFETMASQLAAFDSHFEGRSKDGGTGLTSSEMQKLASLGYVGLQKTASSGAAAVTGTDPKDVIADANKALSAMRALDDGKLGNAITAFRQLLSAEPNAYMAHYGLGVALARQQQYKEAVQHLHRAIELRPDSALAQYEMGVALIKTGDFKTAAVHLEIVSSRLPSFVPAHAALAEAYEHLGRKEDAKRERIKAGK